MNATKIFAGACLLALFGACVKPAPPKKTTPSTAPSIIASTEIIQAPTPLKPGFEERLVSKVPDGFTARSFLWSGGSAYAYLAEKGGETFVIVNDLIGPAIDSLAKPDDPNPLTFSLAPSGHPIYKAIKDGRPTIVFGDKLGPSFDSFEGLRFSKSGVAYIITDGDKSFAVINQKKGAAFSQVRDLRDSADGKVVAYVAQTEQGYTVVVNEKQGPVFDSVGDLFVSSNGVVVYSAGKGEQSYVYVNGEPGPAFDFHSDLQVSQDGTVLYSGTKITKSDEADGEADESEEVVVLAGTLAGAFDEVYSEYLVDDLGEFIFRAVKNNKVIILHRGKQSQPFDDIHQIVSSEGRLAYIVTQQGKQAAVIDGVVGPLFDQISDGSLFVVGESFAYIASKGGKSFLVHGDKQGPSFDFIKSESLLFSGDGKTSAFVATQGGKSFVVVNGTPGEPFEQILEGTFPQETSNGEQWDADFYLNDKGEAVYAVLDQGKQFIVVGGERGPAIEQFYPDTFRFTNVDDLLYVASRDNKDFVVFQGKVGPVVENVVVESLQLLDDGKSLVYLVENNGKTAVVIGDSLGEFFDEIYPEDLIVNRDPSVVYIAKRKGKMHVVVGKKLGPAFDMIQGEDLVFDANGSLVAYKAEKSRKFVVVQGDKSGAAYDEIFVPEVRQDATVSYIAKKGKQEFVVEGGKEGQPYEELDLFYARGSLRYFYLARQGGQEQLLGLKDSPQVDKVLEIMEGKSGWILVVDKGGKQFVVTNGVFGPAVDTISNIFFGKDQRLIYQAQTGKETFVVFGEKASDSFDEITSLLFTQDGQAVYLARRGDKSFVGTEAGARQVELMGPLVGSEDRKSVGYFSVEGREIWFRRALQ